MTDDSIMALREASPREAMGSAEEYEGLLGSVLASDRGTNGSGGARRAYRRWGIAGGLTAAMGVGALAVVLALTAPSPGQRDAASSAYAAVTAAVEKTAEAAESGTITTNLKAVWRDGRAKIGMGSTLKWNGDDMSLETRSSVEGGQNGKSTGGSLYVDGKYYEGQDGSWIHHADADNGKREGVGDVWIDAARKDIGGERLQRIIGVLKDVDTQSSADGTTVYTGWATAKEIDADYRETKGLPYVSRPFPKLGDPEATVKVQIVVGADGIIKSWTAAYSWDNADWVYKCEYGELGTTPAIEGPDPRKVEESDGTWG